MKVKLLHYTPIHIAIKAIRKCHASENLSDSVDGILGQRDKDLIKRIIEMGHESTIEHIYYTFEIKDISRACLQELVRHRIASYSVRSTRFTLHKLTKDKKLMALQDISDMIMHKFDENLVNDIFDKYCVDFENAMNIQNKIVIVHLLSSLARKIKNKVGNDKVKYMLPECFKTELVWTINARALRNFLKLRMSRYALKEIRQLAEEIYRLLPDEHKGTLFFDIMEQ